MAQSSKPTVPPLDLITPDTPLRLDVAAAFAYPDGSMTASGLRKERDRGRLVVERTAGKEYTTLANIAHMRELCRVEASAAKPARERFSTNSAPDTKRARAACEIILADLVAGTDRKTRKPDRRASK